MGRDVYDNRIRPSGRNGTGKMFCLFGYFFGHFGPIFGTFLAEIIERKKKGSSISFRAEMYTTIELGLPAGMVRFFAVL